MRINELNITINKAVIEEVHISLEEDKGLVVYCKGGMYTKNGKKVAEFQYGTNWYGDVKIEVPAFINKPARDIFEMLTPIIYEKINGVYKSLPGKKI